MIPEAAWQRCYVHFLRNALDHLPRKHGDDCLQELRWLFDRRDLAEANGLDADGLVRSAGIVVFGTPDQPVRPAAAEAALAGRRPTDDVLAEVAVIAADVAATDDPRPDADYRRSLTRALVHRALTDALGQEVRA